MHAGQVIAETRGEAPALIGAEMDGQKEQELLSFMELIA
jgi:hypothetical protein